MSQGDSSDFDSILSKEDVLDDIQNQLAESSISGMDGNRNGRIGDHVNAENGQEESVHQDMLQDSQMIWIPENLEESSLSVSIFGGGFEQNER